ncbi:MAG: Sec-independent protein translocase subunit TatA/TatB [Acidimicrobiales bacterium]
MPSSLGPAEILVILVVALIVLGPKRLPEAGRQIGRALAEVRRWSQDIQSEIRDVIDTDASATTTTATTDTTASSDNPSAREPSPAATDEPPPPPHTNS